MPTLPRRALIASFASLAAGRAAHADGETKPGPEPAPAPVAAGALLPLSGDQSLVGDECYRGIQLAVDAINIAGGIGGAPATLLPGDAGAENDAQGAAQSLIANRHAVLILGSGTSAICYSGSAAAELAQTPYIELNAPADGIMARGFKFLLRTGLTTGMIADAACGVIAARYAGKKIGLLFNTGATCGAIAAAVLRDWQTAKISPLLSIGYPPDQVDLNEPVGRLKRAGAEVILHAADTDDVLVFFAAMQNAAWKPTAIIGCGDGYLLRETAYALGDMFEGVIVAGAPFYPPRASYLASAYQARYAMPPRSADSLTAFVGAKLVLDKLVAVNGDVTKLLDVLRRTAIPAGTLANGWGVAFDKTGQNTLSFASLQQWKNGALTALT